LLFHVFIVFRLNKVDEARFELAQSRLRRDALPLELFVL
jgi:hypothetical protein